jgi:hypothetical protein
MIRAILEDILELAALGVFIAAIFVFALAF